MDLGLSSIATFAFVFIGMGLAAMILYAREKLVSKALCKIKINENLVKEVAGGCTLLDALLRNGIPVPSPCGGKATCKQCKVKVFEGGGFPLEPDRATFSRKDLGAGWRLSCQFKVKKDLKVAIPEEMLSVQQFEGIVLSNQNVATFIKELIVEIPQDLKNRSGAYLQVHTPPYKTNTSDWKQTMDPKFYPDWEQYRLFDRMIEFASGSPEIRAYSLASYPAEGKTLKFNVRIATPPFKNRSEERR